MKIKFWSVKFIFLILVIFSASCGQVASTGAGSILVRFVVMSDSQNANENLAVNTEELSKLANIVANLSPLPSFILFSGDLVGTGGSTQLNEWKNVMVPVTNKGIVIYPTPGNHEVANQTLSSQQEYQAAFNLPQNGPAGYEELAYYFEAGNCLFVSLDSYYIDAGGVFHPNEITASQMTWLQNILATRSNTFQFVFTHSPAYPVDGQLGNSLDANPDKRNAFWKILNDNALDIFFAGHEHLYGRWKIGSTQNSSWHNEIYEIITGGAGGPIYSGLTRGIFPDALRMVYHYVVVDAYANSVSVNAYNDEQVLIDSFSITK